MKISNIKIKRFKRFSDFEIKSIPETAKLIIIVGPNGSGKSSLFDAFNQFYRRNRADFGWSNDKTYYARSEAEKYDINTNISISFHNFDWQSGRLPRNLMYFRTAYRNDPDFTINSFSRMGNPADDQPVEKFIDNDQTVSKNYQRLVHETMQGVYAEKNDDKSVRNLREELIGSIRDSMRRVFSDLLLNNIGDPLGDGAFYFEKGTVKSYHYKNLSGGEKSAFDLLLDLIIKKKYFDDTIFVVDEPETHMHTALQGRLVEELYNQVPDNCQLWLTSHSLGVIKKAKEISGRDPGSVVFLDFGEVDFDEAAVLEPASIDAVVWQKFLSITLDDLATDLSPRAIVLCEGSLSGNRRKNFDGHIYQKIASQKYSEFVFVAGGASNDLSKENHPGHELLDHVLPRTKVVRLVDRDDKSDNEVSDLSKRGVLVTGERQLESYLLSDEIIQKFCVEIKEEGLVKDALQCKIDGLNSARERGCPSDDLKSASGQIYNGLRKLLDLRRYGNDVDAFMADTLAPLVTTDTDTFARLDGEIFSKILEE
ncbi:AAA family ATPase [Salinisphaera orenii]|uniref:AAA family ATPase n=1 Tax=Salinisphaera orenii TaxID=856731 RepID=UPI000F4BD984|nr:ATP-binding protein [Salinisphaera orenii]